MNNRKLTKLLKELELLARERPTEVNSPEKAYLTLMGEFREELLGDKECCVMIGLDGRRRMKCSELVSMGTATATLVHPREVFRPAILAACSSILIAHNHPSGDHSPSQEDRQLTFRINEAGKLMGIHLDDHLVVSKHGFTSFRQLGLI